MTRKILLVEDEGKIARLVRLYLEEAGYSVVVIDDGVQAMPAFRHEQPDVVILDLNLPNVDGLDVARALRRESDVPLVMLTARTEEADRLIGLEMGADDYITKPFSPREVVARVRAVLRRVEGTIQSSDERLKAGRLTVDLAAHRASIGEEGLDLTPSEFDLLAAMAEQPGRAFTRLQLLDATQGVVFEGYERSVDQHVKNLRRKLGEAGAPDIIATVRGVGYRLEVSDDAR